ncbi:unnamed protein product [Thelazia callipaeda]|uniref:Uncharacterized protein n=1 Tax=Thelazia callipaeda TaxID=103827 RepID=A0A0N5D3R9_THECL|nr:unnamed protein product [Thelazia callipaeda]
MRETQYSEAALPKHAAMRLVYNCNQSLSVRYSRRLLVYEKTRMTNDGEKAYVEKDCYRESSEKSQCDSWNVF